MGATQRPWLLGLDCLSASNSGRPGTAERLSDSGIHWTTQCLRAPGKSGTTERPRDSGGLGTSRRPGRFGRFMVARQPAAVHFGYLNGQGSDCRMCEAGFGSWR